MASHFTTLVNRAAIIVLGCWGLAVIAPDFDRVFTRYGTLGFEADNDGVVTSVSGAPATGAGIRPGDCVDLAQTPRSDLLAVFGGMGGMTYVRPDLDVTLQVEPAPCTGDPSRATPRALHAAPVSQTAASQFLLALVQVLGIFFIAVAAVLVWQRPSAMTWGFFLYGIWFNPGQYFVFYAQLQRLPRVLLVQEVLQSAAQAVGYAGFIVFALRFPRNVVDARWQWVERALPALVAVLFTVQLMTFGTALGFHTESFARWSYGMGYAVDVAVLLILHSRQNAQSPEDRQRTRWVLWACRVGLLAFIFADSNMATSLWDPVVGRFCRSGLAVAQWTCDDDGTLSMTALLSLFMLSGSIPVAVFHAIHRHRVIDIRFALSRGATLLLSSVIIAGVLAAMERWIEEFLHESFASRVLATVLVIVVLKLVFEWIHALFNRACDRIFFRRLHVAEARLAQVAGELGDAESFDVVDRKLVTEPARCLGLASAAVFRRDDRGRFSQQIDPVGWTGGRQEALPLRESALDTLAHERRPVRLAGPEIGDEARSRTSQPAIAIPIVAAEGLVAIALYGPHSTGSDITAEERTVLESLQAPAAYAYNRIEVVALQRRVAELSRKVADLPYGVLDIQ